jgi:hypothetical protein
LKNETEQIKKSILIPLGIAFVALLAITVGGVQWWTWSQSARETEDAVRGAQRVYEAVLAKDAEVMLGLLDCIEEDEGLRKAWLARDRETLLRRAQPRFDEFKRKYRVTHFYFHGPDRLNFLRVHQPSRHGDLIDRYTLEDAARRQQASWGVELGPLGTFTLRVVVPWYIDGTWPATWSWARRSPTSSASSRRRLASRCSPSSTNVLCSAPNGKRGWSCCGTLPTGTSSSGT